MEVKEEEEAEPIKAVRVMLEAEAINYIII